MTIVILLYIIQFLALMYLIYNKHFYSILLKNDVHFSSKLINCSFLHSLFHEASE